MSEPNTWAKAKVRNDWGSAIANISLKHRYDHDHFDEQSWVSLKSGEESTEFSVGYWTGFGRTGYDYWLIQFEADGRIWTCKDNFYCFLASDDQNQTVVCRVYRKGDAGEMQVRCPQSSSAAVSLSSRPAPSSSNSQPSTSPKAGQPSSGTCDGTVAPDCVERAPGPIVSFEEALRIGAIEVGGPGGMAFSGLVTGSAETPDAADRYDTRYWKEPGGMGHLVPKDGISAWIAFKNLVLQVGKQIPISQPRNDPEYDRWAFDCAGFVVVNRIYAYYRTMTNIEFNKKFGPGGLGTLDIGTKSNIWGEFDRSMFFLSTGPSEPPTVMVRDSDPRYNLEAKPHAVNARKTMHDLINEVPIGSHISWANLDAFNRCQGPIDPVTKVADQAKAPHYAFCLYQVENTTKVGQDEYSAHPMGIKSCDEVELALAHSVIDERITLKQLSPEVPRKDPKYFQNYIGKYVYISSILVPKGCAVVEKYKGAAL